ncbi:lipid particle protein, partial [Auricularia subglabra TFB-10046 SS5]
TMKDVHLLVVIHGMWGQPSHVSTAAQIIQETFAAKQSEADSGLEFDVLLAETNRELHTYDGIDWCAERVVKEVMERKATLEKDGLKRVARFSVFGYSLGGLVARYAIGILYSQEFFKAVTPVNFTTFATPHIGLIDYATWWSRTVEFIGSRLLSRTGEQFFAHDKWSPDGQPLLLAMSDKGLCKKIFYKALRSFPNLRIYANGVKDRTVPFVTAYITTHDPFIDYPASGLQVKYDPKYYPVITSYDTPAERPPPPPPAPLYKRLAFPLPPFLNRGMPFNLFIYAALPLLIPVFIGLVLTRFAVATHASRKRIKLLESDAPAETRLGRLWREFNQEVGETIADMSGTRSPSPVEKYRDDDSAPPQKGAPVLTARQKQIVANLNSIPHLRKHIAFVPHYMNAHAVIVCRDPAQFSAHEEGKGVIRHWADRFEF